MEVVSALFSCDLVDVMAGDREHPLPAPILAGIRVLSVQSVGQTDTTLALPQVLLMLALDGLEVSQERVLRGSWEHCVAVLVALTGPHDNLILTEVDILDDDNTP